MDVITTGGMRMPKLGLGTWPMKGRECADAVRGALQLGYRHLDTAEMYGNEEAVGEGLAASGVPRGDVHVTSKVWHEHLAPDAMRAAMDATLQRLRTEYVDLYLIHWPSPEMDLPAALDALRRLKQDGKARAVGVSNFPVALMRRAVEELGAEIACNQVEYHVLLTQDSVLDYARPHGIAVTAYAPLGRGDLASNPALAAIAKKHGASATQVALKWLLDQDGVAAIPKSASEKNQRANLDALRIALDAEDRAAIAALPKNKRYVNPDWAPVWDRVA